MSSRRMIDPAFWQSQTVAALPIPTRYFFVGLFSNADDQGRLRGHPALLRSMIYPYDDIALADIGEMLLDLAGDGGPILLYEVDGKTLIQIRNWWKWQHLTWAWPSDLPAPVGWVDRLCYRRGNAVVKSNWDSPEETAAPPIPESDATVAPQWPQSDTAVRPAPSISINSSNSTSGNSSGNGSSNTATDGTAPVLLVGGDDLSDYDADDDGLDSRAQLEAIGLQEPTLAECAAYPPDIVTRWVVEAKRLEADGKIRSLPGWVVTKLRSGASPPARKYGDDDWHRFERSAFADCFYQGASNGPDD